MRKLRFLSFAISFLAYTTASAQSIDRLALRTRIDWFNKTNDGVRDEPASRLKASYALLNFDATIYKGLTFSYRHRLTGARGSFWKDIDWCYLKYDFGKFAVSGGKIFSNNGGYEIDRNPIDVFYYANWDMNYWVLGGQFDWKITDHDKLSFQVSESQFTENYTERALYGYTLNYTAKHSIWSTISSFGTSEIADNRYYWHLTLGNRFTLGPCALEFDIHNRCVGGKTSFWFKDCSLITNFTYDPCKHLRIHAKWSYDRNASGVTPLTHSPVFPNASSTLDNTQTHMISGGLEYFPLKDESLRFHAVVGFTRNSLINESLPTSLANRERLMINIGATYNLDILELGKACVKKMSSDKYNK